MSSTKFIYPTSAVLKTNISANQLYQLVLFYQIYQRHIGIDEYVV